MFPFLKKLGQENLEFQTSLGHGGRLSQKEEGSVKEGRKEERKKRREEGREEEGRKRGRQASLSSCLPSVLKTCTPTALNGPSLLFLRPRAIYVISVWDFGQFSRHRIISHCI